MSADWKNDPYYKFFESIGVGKIPTPVFKVLVVIVMFPVALLSLPYFLFSSNFRKRFVEIWRLRK
jgi:hypothetical protein